ncbi:cyclohexanecarboxylate-CoA ligase [Variovorax sp. HW608]|uniref:AMP-binding protein n=1 Tax=Variovorax sp. HW608 TaxID=1034889 RepID=UPI00081FEC9A|nr:AMP-binding protein [Variovorax sp. HW608]SCK30944.1 cyclohexanecarboxylate-CoA ligase [Variovorax sp. HW608]
MTVKEFDPVAHGQAMRAGGWWLDRTIDDCLCEAIRRAPTKDALVGWRADRADPVRISYQALGDKVALAAGALRDLGVGHGDIVAVQVPNWWEFVVVSLACGRIGAVVNPLMPIFRERELEFMLGFAEAKVFVVPAMFRGFDHAAMAQELKKKLPKLQQVIVVDGDGPNAFDRLLLQGKHRIEAAVTPAGSALVAEELAVMMFTSGTTGSPKGVMHSCNTLLACNKALSGRFGLTADDVLLACSPLGHMTGYAAVMVLGVFLGSTVVLQDIWEARRGVTIMAAEGVTYTAASSPFLSDICNAVAEGAPRPTALRSFLCGGAPIPPVLIERAARELDLKVCSLWGMTESLSSTLTEPARAADKSSKTDGRPLDGVEIRIVDFDGKPLSLGQTGRLLVRGAQMSLGYYKRPDIPTYDAEGWFDTGDLAYMDAEGYIRINGRTKDVLIRGGENVPVVEIEALLYKHPAVALAAIVGYPDARLGERACAFVELRPGATLDLAAVQAYMAECKVAKQYWPERVEIIEGVPRTPSGKIQKFILKERAKAFGTEMQAPGA